MRVKFVVSCWEEDGRLDRVSIRTRRHDGMLRPEHFWQTHRGGYHTVRLSADGDILRRNWHPLDAVGITSGRNSCKIDKLPWCCACSWWIGELFPRSIHLLTKFALSKGYLAWWKPFWVISRCIELVFHSRCRTCVVQLALALIVIIPVNLPIVVVASSFILLIPEVQDGQVEKKWEW